MSASSVESARGGRRGEETKRQIHHRHVGDVFRVGRTREDTDVVSRGNDHHGIRSCSGAQGEHDLQREELGARVEKKVEVSKPRAIQKWRPRVERVVEGRGEARDGRGREAAAPESSQGLLQRRR